MKISLLNERLLFQKSVVKADGIGNRKNEWTDYFSCYATISGENGSERMEAGTTAEMADVAFTVRYCGVLEAVDSTGYRILFRGEIYNIISVDHMNYRKKSLKFKCKKVRR